MKKVILMFVVLFTLSSSIVRPVQALTLGEPVLYKLIFKQKYVLDEYSYKIPNLNTGLTKIKIQNLRLLNFQTNFL